MRYGLICIATVAAAALFNPHTASAAPLQGAWSGGGTIVLKGGARERVRCRVSYSKGSGRAYSFNATCSSTAGAFSQSGTVIRKGSNSYSGRAYNSNYDVTGRVNISVRGKKQTVTLRSPKGSGSLSLRRR